MNDIQEKVRALGRVLEYVNTHMPCHAFERLSFEREEDGAGKFCLCAADIPKEFWEEAAEREAFRQRIAVEALRFGEGDYLSMHRHNAAASSILIPGKDASICELLTVEMFKDERSERGTHFLKRSTPCGIHPKVWHEIRRVGEGNYAYILSASAPIIGNDVEWYL